MTATKPEGQRLRPVVTADTTRDELSESISHLRADRQRLPIHWVEARDAISDEIDALVATWLAFQCGSS